MSELSIEVVGPDYGEGKDEVRSLAGLFRREKVKPETLGENLRKFLQAFDEALKDVPSAVGGYKVDALELSLEVGAKGTVSLLGNGGEVSGTGGIILKLSRAVE